MNDKNSSKEKNKRKKKLLLISALLLIVLAIILPTAITVEKRYFYIPNKQVKKEIKTFYIDFWVIVPRITFKTQKIYNKKQIEQKEPNWIGPKDHSVKGEKFLGRSYRLVPLLIG
ncbi:MAG: hypothetical protein ACOC5R_01990, partial [Elusimicrobiota bacterium]